jgi:hypothetical protein
MAAVTTHEVHDRWRHEDINSYVHHKSTILLQWTDGLMNCLQNAAGRLVACSGMQEHVTPVLRQLHRLPVLQRVQFKLATLFIVRWQELYPHVRRDHTKYGHWNALYAPLIPGYARFIAHTTNSLIVPLLLLVPVYGTDHRSSFGIQTLHLIDSNDY